MSHLATPYFSAILKIITYNLDHFAQLEFLRLIPGLSYSRLNRKKQTLAVALKDRFILLRAVKMHAA